jgi:hypothetical protein
VGGRIVAQNFNKSLRGSAMQKSIITLSTLVLALVFFVGSAMAGASAKFAAAWSNTAKLESVVTVSGDADDVVTQSKNGWTIATIKVPQDKELLVGLSAEIGLVTDTSVKGRNGGSAKAEAGAQAYVNIYAVPTGYDGEFPVPASAVHALPYQVMLTERIQALSATLGGVIQSCEDTTGGLYYPAEGAPIAPGEPGYVDTPDGVINIALECLVTDEEIGLMLDTTAAHHFNFILPNMDAGEYDIVAIFSTGARAEIDICDDATDWCLAMFDADGEASASATASAIINKYVMTVQQVRAVNSDLFTEDTIIEIVPEP